MFVFAFIEREIHAEELSIDENKNNGKNNEWLRGERESERILKNEGNAAIISFAKATRCFKVHDPSSIF